GAVRIEVAAQRILQLADFFFLPGNVAPGRIHAHAQHLGIVGGELVEVTTVRRHLLASGRRPIEGIKRQDNIFAPVIAETHLVPAVSGHGWDFKIRGYTTNFEHYDPPSYTYTRSNFWWIQRTGVGGNNNSSGLERTHQPC